MKYKIYEYHWMDHYERSEWVSPNSLFREPFVVKGVGMLVGKDKHYYYFTQGITPTGQYNSLMAVMRKNVVKLHQIGSLDFSSE